MSPIPVFSAAAQYAALKTDIDAAMARVLASGSFILGNEVREFERELAAYVGVKEAVALNSGTDALYLALRALGIGRGDEVITSPFTFFATSEAIVQAGAKPVFVDIDPTTFCLDAQRLDAAVTAHTKAILPVHLYGLPADMAAVREIAAARKLFIIEDCAQAIGASVDGRRVGALSDAGCFSFFPTKNLGAFGDGGAITTDSADVAARVRSLRAHGGRVKYVHDECGINSRLDELQAAVLRVKLPHLERFNAARRQRALRYDAFLASSRGIAVPSMTAGRTHVYHQYTVRLERRDAVRERLAAAGVQTMVYYPVPLHLQAAHADLGYAVGAFPHAEAASLEVLSLPMYPELHEDEQARVVELLADACRSEAA